MAKKVCVYMSMSKAFMVPLVMVHFEAVTGDGADEQRQQAQCAGIKHRIAKGTPDILLQDQLLVILDQMESREKSSSQYIRTVIGGCRDHPVQREHRDYGCHC